ncbi:hypothetical protein [Streptomyces galbus]|nr:hypothetical protein [Streptomyces galbus]
MRSPSRRRSPGATGVALGVHDERIVATGFEQWLRDRRSRE